MAIGEVEITDFFSEELLTRLRRDLVSESSGWDPRRSLGALGSAFWANGGGGGNSQWLDGGSQNKPVPQEIHEIRWPTYTKMIKFM